jgi:hypothetical protein
MNLRERIREWTQPIYFLGQNPITLAGAVITTSTALTTIAFWFYDVFLPGTSISTFWPINSSWAYPNSSCAWELT